MTADLPPFVPLDDADGQAPWRDPAAGSGRLAGWPQWMQAVRDALVLAAHERRHLWMVAPDYVQWPLGTRADVEAWSHWAAASRHTTATVLAVDWERSAQAHPRWVRWQPTWAHRVSCRMLAEEDRASLQDWAPSLVVSGLLALEVLDADQGSGRWTRIPGDIRVREHQIDAISQRSSRLTPGAAFGL